MIAAPCPNCGSDGPHSRTEEDSEGTIEVWCTACGYVFPELAVCDD